VAEPAISKNDLTSNSRLSETLLIPLGLRASPASTMRSSWMLSRYVAKVSMNVTLSSLYSVKPSEIGRLSTIKQRWPHTQSLLP